MALPAEIHIRELGPREGFQTLRGILVPLETKLELIKLLSRSGVGEIEITALVNPKLVPQMADADQLVAQYERTGGIRYTGLYLNQRGFERAEGLGRLDNQSWLISATSDTFLAKNSNSSRARIVSEVESWLELFRRYKKPLYGLMISTAFGCGYEGKGAAKQLLPTLIDLVTEIERAGGSAPSEISLADTVGMGTPEEVRRTVAEVKSCFPTCKVSLHLHDTMGMAVANAYAGLLEGVTIFDASVGGLGGCPFTPGAAGNIATEELLHLCDDIGIKTGINIDAYIEAARFIESALQIKVPSRVIRSRVRPSESLK